jgi:hypothetical protein
VDAGDGVVRDVDVEVADVGVERRVQDALLGDLADEDQLVDLRLAQQVLQRRLVASRRRRSRSC